ncbi:MAG: PAS domain S-box protein [Methanoregula sp.]
MTDFHYVPGSDHIHLDVIAPLARKSNGAGKPVGAVLLSIDPEDFLYPLIQSWPVPSGSAETLLVEREGDHVLFLNELRHRNNTALNLTIPLIQTDVPSVMAVLGTTGAFEGTDYRGADVISVLEPIPGSPWFIVAKVDTGEAYSSWRSRSALIVALVAGTVISVFIIIGLVWQRRQKYFYRSLYATEAERNKEELQNRERLETLLRLSEMQSASEQELMDFVLDAGCRLTNSSLSFIGVMSPDEAVFDITAWSKSAMKDCSVAASPIHFPIEKAGIWAEAVRKRTPLIVNDYNAPQAAKKGLPPGHVPITRFASIPIFDQQRIVMVCAVANKDADYTPLDVDNLTLLMQGVWNHLRKRSADEALRQKTTDLEAAYEEITASDEELAANYDELAKSQQALAESERKYRTMIDWTYDWEYWIGPNRNVIYVSPSVERITGYAPTEFIADKDLMERIVHPDDRARWEEHLTLHANNTQSSNSAEIEFRIIARDGSTRWIGHTCQAIFADDDTWAGRRISNRDITGRKRAEEALRETNEYLTSLFDYANAPIIVWDTEFRITRFNHAFERLTGSIAEGVIGKPVDILFPDDSRQRSMALLGQATGGERWEAIEIPIHRKDGSRRTVLWNSATIYADDGTTVIATIAQGQDITDRKQAEEALRESERLYRSLFENMLNGFAYCKMIYEDGDPRDFTYLAVNRAFGELTGLHDVEGKNVSVVIPGIREADPRLFEVYGRVASTGIPERFEIFVESLTMWFSISVYSPQHGYFVTVFDVITDRKAAEESLRESEKRFRSAFDLAAIGMSLTALDGRFMKVNQAFTRMMGYSEEEVLQSNYTDLTYPEDIASSEAERLDLLFSTKEAAHFEKRYMKKDGRIIRAFVSHILVRDENNKPQYFVTIIQDITERKVAEDALRESEHRFRNLVETTSDWVWEVDETGHYTYSSPQIFAILGYNPEELPGKTPFDFMPPEEAARVGEIFSKIVASQQMFSSLENTNLHKDGHKVILDTSGVPVFRPDGTFCGYRGIDRDITDRKRAEEALRETNEYLRSLLDYANAPIIVWDPEFRITRFNHAFEDLTGMTEREAIGQHISRLFPESSREASLELIQKTVAGERWEVVEIPILHRYGEIRMVLWNSANIVDPSGTLISTIAQGQDITERKAAEEDLKSSNAFLDMIIDMSPFSMWICDKEGTVTRVNRSLCQTIRLTPDDIVGKYNVLRDTNLETQGVMPGVRAVFDNYTPARFSIRWKAADAGDVDFKGARDMHIDVSLFPILNARGELTHVVCQWVDITERKNAEDALRETNEYLQNLIDYANAPIIVWDPQFRITRFNHAFEKLTGRTEEDVIGQHLAILFPESSRDGSVEQIKKTLEGERWEVVEIPILHRSGEIRIVLWNSANIVSPDGTIISTIAQGTDITGRKLAEEALRGSEASYRVLAENLPGIVYRIHLREDNRMVFFNDQLTALSGYAPEELVKGAVCSIEPFIHPDDIPRVLAAVEKAVAESTTFSVEYRFRHKDGSWRYFIERGKVVPGQDLAPQFIDGVIHDVTDRKLTETQREKLIRTLEQKNTELERYTYTVSHDLKSPLITIRGFAGLLEDDALKADHLLLKKDIHRITEAADTMQSLLADLLELSRVGRIVNPPEKIPFGRIVSEAVDLLAGSLTERGVTVEIAPDLPEVIVDSARIREVMVNLIENAIKFLGNRPDPKIRIGVDTTGETPVFFVQDNGIGINPRYLERIFNLFEKLDASARGTGIGLTISRRIIEVHGGKIWAESEGPGKGTTFRFTLPAVPAGTLDHGRS